MAARKKRAARPKSLRQAMRELNLVAGLADSFVRDPWSGRQELARVYSRLEAAATAVGMRDDPRITDLLTRACSAQLDRAFDHAAKCREYGVAL